MPAKSEAQRKWAFAVKGPAWAKEHHFDTAGPLPKYAANHQAGTTNVGLALFRAQMAKHQKRKK